MFICVLSIKIRQKSDPWEIRYIDDVFQAIKIICFVTFMISYAIAYS